jgi:hypothetical protein
MTVVFFIINSFVFLAALNKNVFIPKNKENEKRKNISFKHEKTKNE